MPPSVDAERGVNQLKPGIAVKAGVKKHREIEKIIRDPNRPVPQDLAREQPDVDYAGQKSEELGEGHVFSEYRGLSEISSDASNSHAQ